MCKGEQQVGEEEVAGGVESWMNGQDPGIKLFGRMISAPNGSENDEGAGDLTGSDNEEESVNPLADSDHSSEEAVGHLDEDRASTWGVDELGSSSGSNSGCEDEKPSGLDLSSGSPAKPIAGLRPLQVLSEIEEEQLPSTKSSEEITARKPEKAAPCPRCESLDTKFCYFNNYNVNQPRHFCKHCQRYWTAGGTLRNVPVGAGRRKSKNSSVAQQQIQQQQQQQQLLPFDCFAVRRSEGDAAQQLLPQPFRPILPVERALHSSCSPAPSTITTLKQQNPYPGGNRSSAFTPKAAGMTSNTAAGSEKATVAAGPALQADATSAAIPKLQCFSAISREVSSDAQIKSTVAQSKCSEAASSAFSAMDRKQEQQQQPPQEATDACGMQQTEAAADAAPGGWVSAAAAAPFGFFNGPWPPYVFNPGWSGVSQPHVASPFFHPAAAAAAAALPPQMFAFPWCHPSMWAAVPGSWSAPPVTWATPWEAAAATMAAAAAASATASSAMVTPGSSLGKHPRERHVLPEGRIEGPLWLPKTLRIDDQGEQVRSSILASLGLTADAQPHNSVAHPKAEAYPVSAAAPLN